MSYPTFEDAQRTVEKFLALLDEMGIEIRAGSQSESDALSMLDVIEVWQGRRPPPADSRELIRAAMGFVDIAGKVVSVANKPDFDKLRPHLELISKTAVLQNRPSSVLDRDADKTVELYVACLAMKLFSNVAVDHPTRAKGDNPDVMFDFRGKRWAIALKTAHSTTVDQLCQNISKGANQISASNAEHGLILVNLRNKLRHDDLWPDPNIAQSEGEASDALRSQIDSIVHVLDSISGDDWKAIFRDAKATVPVLFMGHSAFLGYPSHDERSSYFMPVKMLYSYLDPVGDPVGAMKLANALNHEMQQFQ